MFSRNMHQDRIRRIFCEGMDVAPPIPGEAPSQVSNQSVITEPTNAGGDGSSIYELYPDLANVDITSACTLADFFASLCEEEQASNQVQQQSELVPSLAATNTPNEF